MTSRRLLGVAILAALVVALLLMVPQVMHLPATDRTTDTVVAPLPWLSLALFVLIAIGLGLQARR